MAPVQRTDTFTKNYLEKGVEASGQMLSRENRSLNEFDAAMRRRLVLDVQRNAQRMAHQLSACKNNTKYF